MKLVPSMVLITVLAVGLLTSPANANPPQDHVDEPQSGQGIGDDDAPSKQLTIATNPEGLRLHDQAPRSRARPVIRPARTNQPGPSRFAHRIWSFLGLSYLRYR